MKTILIVGLGRFGRHMAKTLTELDNEVMAVDIVEDRVNDALPYVTNAQIGDATKSYFLESLGVGNFDICVVAEHLAVKCSASNIFEYIELMPDYSIFEISVPEAWVGKSIVQKAVRTKFHISILATKENNVISPLPSADYVFKGTETIVIMGHNDDIKKLLR